MEPPALRAAPVIEAKGTHGSIDRESDANGAFHITGTEARVPDAAEVSEESTLNS